MYFSWERKEKLVHIVHDHVCIINSSDQIKEAGSKGLLGQASFIQQETGRENKVNSSISSVSGFLQERDIVKKKHRSTWEGELSMRKNAQN